MMRIRMPHLHRNCRVKMVFAAMVTLLAALATTVVVIVCAPDFEPPTVLVITLDAIYRMKPLQRPSYVNYKAVKEYKGFGYVKNIDFNYANKSFCYIYPKYGIATQFLCASADDFQQSWEIPSPPLYPKQETVTVMARDWASGAWYFVDKLRRCLYVCDDTLQNCRVLATDVEEPLGLAVDPTPPGNDAQKAGFIFWSQNNTSPSRLVRSSLAGDDVIGLLPRDCSELCTPKALTLDVVNKLLYWIDGSYVVASNYDGTNKKSVYKIPDPENREMKVFSIAKRTIYMPGYRGLWLVTLPSEDSTEPGNITEVYTTLWGYPRAAAVYHKSRQPTVPHPCMENKGDCEHICVTAYQGTIPVARCLCRHGFQLDEKKHGVCNKIELDSFLLISRGKPPEIEVRAPGLQAPAAPAGSNRPTVADVDTKTDFLYFSDTYKRQIIRQKLNGTERYVLIKDDIYECQGLAIDWMGGNIYWTDDPLGRVSVARISNPMLRRNLIRESLYHPYSIVLDPQRGVMYWSLWAKGPTSASIETAHMDGSERRVLASKDLEWPSGLVLDLDKQVLYWCDTKLNKIESLELATNKRSTILAAPEADIKEAYGMVLVDGDLMWSEQKSGRLRRLFPNGTVTTVDTVTPPVYDIRMVSRSARNGTNACSSNNGGCAELCLATPTGRTCACADSWIPDPSDPTRCIRSESKSAGGTIG